MSRSRSKHSLPASSPRLKEAAGGAAVVLELPKEATPEITGYASRCFVEEGEWEWYVVFFDERWGVVANCVLSLDALVGPLWSSSARFFDVTHRWLEERGIPLPGLVQESPMLEAPIPAQVNVFRMSRHGLEAQLDCYYLTPHSIINVQRKTGEPVLVPMFSLQLSLPLLVALLARVQDRVPAIRERMERYGVAVTKLMEEGEEHGDE